jgi:hypothetical protein
MKRRRSTARDLRKILQHVDTLLEGCDDGFIDQVVALSNMDVPSDYTDRLRVALTNIRAIVEAKLRLHEVNKKPGSRAG